MICTFCPNTIGEKYATMIGPDGKHVFQICWPCWERTDTQMTGYHPSLHFDGPPDAETED